jgi:hypothetical protein
MGKLIFWIVIVFGLLLVARLVNAAAAKRRKGTGAGSPGGDARASPMVRCVRCGVFLPRSEARTVPDGHACSDPGCAGSR